MGPVAPPPADPRTRNDLLLRSLPGQGDVVLQVGAHDGWLASELKAGHPHRIVYGAEGSDRAAPGSASLDERHVLDLERDTLPLPPGTIDCIVYPGSLAGFADPVSVLERHRELLSPTGTILCSFPNVQHHSVVTQLLRGAFPYEDASLVQPGDRRLFTVTSAIQTLLDAGFEPEVAARLERPADQHFLAAAAPLLELLGVGAADAARHLGTADVVLRGRPLAPVDPADDRPLTIVACVNDEDQLRANLLHSPCLRGDRHQVLLFRGCTSAAAGLNAGIAQAEHELVVLVHQDVYLPKDWPARLFGQWRTAALRPGTIGIAGVFGVLDRRVPFDSVGHVVHGDRLLTHRTLPSDVDGLDELLMVVPRDTQLRVDASLGWHLYGTDLALQAQQRGQRVVVLDALCQHNAKGRIPANYRDSERVFARKWRSLLPLHTNISSIDDWLIDEDATRPAALAVPEPPETEDAGTMVELIARLRAEQAALSAELERARVQVASMRSSPFWLAREAVVAALGRVTGRR